LFFAAHHQSGNIAAQRFKGLLKYLDPMKYRVFVFTRKPASGASDVAVPTGPDVSIFPLSGHCVGSESSAMASMLILATAFMRSLPFMRSNDKTHARPWFAQALAEADRLCREKLAVGERCVVIGTYSPVDALIAAASLASRYHIGCVQDFRDGLVFRAAGQARLAANVHAQADRGARCGGQRSDHVGEPPAG
jgi:hypothetical protein